jgi:hypothetical protein
LFPSAIEYSLSTSHVHAVTARQSIIPTAAAGISFINRPKSKRCIQTDGAQALDEVDAVMVMKGYPAVDVQEDASASGPYLLCERACRRERVWTGRFVEM